MKKIQDFLKSNLLVIKWSIWYFVILWAILKFLFNFDMFSASYWWKFFHATLHGFGGFVFGILIYSAIPIYIATVAIIHRKKEPLFTFAIFDKIKDFVEKLLKVFQKKTAPIVAPSQPEPTLVVENPQQQIPSDLPAELRIPFMRAKNHVPLTGAVSVYNKNPIQTNNSQTMHNQSDIPLPMDFDISDSLNAKDENIPTFSDINFDEPEIKENALQNNTTKYFDARHIKFDTLENFIATDKYLIYEHSDGDFWIMDENVWFANGKQIASPTNELIHLALQNELTPVIYLQSQNIMDIESTIEQFESIGIKVIKSLEELD